MNRIIIGFTAALFVALPVHGQSGQTGHQGHGSQGGMQHGAMQHGEQGAGHEGMNCPHMQDAAHRHAPKVLLQHGEMLSLTAEQTEQLEALQARHHEACHERMQQRKAAQESADAALLQSSPDLAAYERYLRQAAELEVTCRVDMARTSQQGVALLTAAQRQHLSHIGQGGHGGH